MFQRIYISSTIGNKIYYILLLLIMLTICCDRKIFKNTISLTKVECTHLLDNYVTALSTGDSNTVKLFWSERSLERRGFWTIHNHFFPWGNFADWKTNITESRFETQRIDWEKEYYVLRVKWIPQDTIKYQSRNLKFYLINENNHWVFINPVDIFTSDWKSYSTENIVFHYPPEIDINNYLQEIQYAEREFSKALNIFGIQLTRKIDFYKARTDIECGKLMNFGPVNGFVLMPHSTEKSFGHDIWFVASSSFVNHHELIHVVTGLAGIPFKSPAITEGLACAFAGAFHTTSGFMTNDARNQIIQSLNFPLKELLTMDNQTFTLNNYIVYPQAGSFIKYLYDVFGMKKLIDFCSNPMENINIITNLEANYDRTLSQLEKDWIAWILRQETPVLGTTIPSEAEPVFSMSDEVGDDTGDGDYVYPAYSNYPIGCFDLKKFEVLKDDTNTYFRIEIVKLKPPLVLGSENRAEKVVVGCIIAIQKGKMIKQQRQKHCHGVTFSDNDGYDLKVNVGTNVSLSNIFGEIFFSSPEIVTLMSNYEKNTIEFSIPTKLIGEPEKDWKYFVGTCLISNRTMNFLGEPMLVYRNPPSPIFISGGNFDYGNPSYMDILLPVGSNQTKILSAYSTDSNHLAIVPMVSR